MTAGLGAADWTEEAPALIRVRGMSKTFGGVAALQDVDIDIRPGVVHGLVGANGAGKSTFIRALAGVGVPDTGSVLVDGQEVQIHDPEAARRLGLAFIHQELSLIPGWDVMRNMALGAPVRTRLGIVDWRPTRERARAVAARIGLTKPLGAAVESLSAAERSLVLIGRALMHDARMIAMDEPTAALSAAEAERLHRIIRALAADGTAVLFVSHRLDEVTDLCRDITVFKDGRVVQSVVDEQMSKPDLIRAIVGRDLEIVEHGHAPVKAGDVMVQVRDLWDRKTLRGVSLDICAGEVVGLAGLVGAGRTELAKVIFGAARATSGEVLLRGRPVAFGHPADAVRAGIGFVPEERRSEGLFLDQSIDFNINLSSLDSMTRSRFWPFLRPKAGRERAQVVADAVTVKAANILRKVGTLSGGNQQKVAIARWLVEPPAVLILDEPSRGVDVGGRAEVHSVIRGLASSGVAVLAISSDNEELVGLCDRVLVMARGRINGELAGSALTVDNLVHLSFAHDRPKVGAP